MVIWNSWWSNLQMRDHDLGHKGDHPPRAAIEFTIDKPLQMGASVQMCRIKKLDVDCVSPRVSHVACWSSDPPDGATGCCEDAEGGGGGGRGPRLGRGEPGDLAVPPLGPFWDWPPDDDTPTIDVDGVRWS